MKRKETIIKMTLSAFLCALTVVASRFLSVNVWNMSIGFSFLPVMIAALLLGSLWGGLCGGLADLIGALLFPFGPYFPGFTLTAFLSGFLFGLMPKNSSLKKFAGLSALIITAEEIVCTVVLNSLWIAILYDSPFMPLVITRLPKAAIMLPIQLFVAILVKHSLLKPLNNAMNKY